MSIEDGEPGLPGGWLTAEQQRAWLVYMRVQLRLRYEMNRQLQNDSGLSLADYDVLVALSTAPDRTMQMTELANHIGWERSRTSHHVRRMESRDLLWLRPSPEDRRAVDISPSDHGMRVFEKAVPGHIALVRGLVFEELPDDLLGSFAEVMERIHDSLLANGSLPPPKHPGY
ncbi:MAG TPA: MarR family winged helix-turn-helix transcriptional regulator [Kutzneria sp.]|jgi:DNA-binding MarR family transcriptional regulator|nr:MarR family winged helix-turn-helix transcriptional regulator [Kutzneria sp.]